MKYITIANLIVSLLLIAVSLMVFAKVNRLWVDIAVIAMWSMYFIRRYSTWRANG